MTDDYKHHVLIKYLTNCRNCLKSDGVTNAWYYITSEKYELNQSTEFELSNKISHLKSEDPHICPFCESKNVELYNFYIDYGTEIYKSYDYDRLSRTMNYRGKRYFWQFNINKRKNELDSGTGGTVPHPMLVSQACITNLFKELDNIPSINFKFHERGLFFVCYSIMMETSPTNTFEVNLDCKVEKLLYHGITKEEIITSIESKYQNIL